MGINGEFLTMAQACGEAPVHPRGYVAGEGAVLAPEAPERHPDGLSDAEHALRVDNERLRGMLRAHGIDPGPDPDDEDPDGPGYRDWVDPESM